MVWFGMGWDQFQETKKYISEMIAIIKFSIQIIF